MRQAILAAAAAAACAVFLSANAAAQMPASALGKPLPDANLDDGTVTVRVIAGGPDRPVTGESVTLSGGGDELTARTNASGRAQFPDLEPGTAYVASVDGEGGPVESDRFEVPASGGVRLMLSTKKVAGGGAAPGMGGGGPAMGGGARGMPDPRQMSGIPRPEANDPRGRLTVRAVQGSFSSTESDAPEGAVVHLVGYGADGSVTKTTKPVPEEGRVRFDDLTTGGAVAYYATALFPRDGGVDRLSSRPVTLPPKVGMRLMLAGHAADSTKPPIDELAETSGTSGASVAPGTVVARLVGQVRGVREVELVELGDPGRASRSPVGQPTPLASDVRGRVAPPETDESMTGGTVGVQVVRRGQGLAGATVRIVPAGGDGEAGEAVTDGGGSARVEGLSAGDELRAVVTVHGKELESEPFTVPAKGGVRIEVQTDWRTGGFLEAQFHDVPSGPEKVYAAQVRVGDRVYRSVPFQLSEERGAAVSIVVYESLLLRFHIGGELDDRHMWFDAQMALRNPTTAPHVPADGRVAIPIPEGFSTAKVSEEHAARVKVVDGVGFAWRGPVSPGREVFRGQFAIPVEGGGFRFDMPLPHGAMNSQIIVSKLPGMKLDVPEGTQRETRTLDNGREFTMLSGINIGQGERLVMSAEGLPHKPVWRRYVRWGIGAIVTALLLWGFSGLFRRRGAAAPGRASELEGRRERLLDELTQLERRRKQGKVTEARYQTRRENLRLDLEGVYAELDRDGSGAPRKSG